MHPIVILGSGLAGYSVAKELRKLDADVPITVVTEDDGDFYPKPSLSNAYALKKAPPALVTASAAQMAADFRLEVLAHTRVEAIDRARRVVRAGGRELPYARLVLALGGRPIGLKLAGDGVGRVLSVNDLGAYRRFRAAVEPHRRIALLGAGLVGCEFANDLAGAGYEVDVIDIAPRPLARFWPQVMASDFQSRLAAAGVRWHLGESIERVDVAEGGLAVGLGDGSRVEADAVLSAVGLSANTALAQEAGLAVGRAIVVDRHLQTSDPDIFALGDCAEVEGRLLPFIMPIMHAARALARTLAGTRSAVVYPAMPVLLKTPACPAVFFPALVPGGGKWHVEDGEQGMRGFYRAADGTLLAAALSGGCTREREAVQRQLPAVLPAA